MVQGLCVPQGFPVWVVDGEDLVSLQGEPADGLGWREQLADAQDVVAERRRLVFDLSARELLHNRPHVHQNDTRAVIDGEARG